MEKNKGSKSASGSQGAGRDDRERGTKAQGSGSENFSSFCRLLSASFR